MGTMVYPQVATYRSYKNMDVITLNSATRHKLNALVFCNYTL